jgi:hypothetical protein
MNDMSTKKVYYVYDVIVIDAFPACMNVVDYVNQFTGLYLTNLHECISGNLLTSIGVFLSDCREQIPQWEGDIRGGYENLMIFSVPATDCNVVGAIIKQDNNGSTFVVSPVPFSHLEGYIGCIESCDISPKY